MINKIKFFFKNLQEYIVETFKDWFWPMFDDFDDERI